MLQQSTRLSHGNSDLQLKLPETAQGSKIKLLKYKIGLSFEQCFTLGYESLPYRVP